MNRSPKYEFRTISFAANTPMEKRAIGFARVSTVRQGEGTSIGDQVTRIEEYAARSGLALIGLVILHESGKDSNRRPAFNQGLAVVAERKARHIVFYHSDRIGRNLTDHERLHDDDFRVVGILANALPHDRVCDAEVGADEYDNV